eukprot:TRINITY_DN91586_c0_g1_i1.p1 TRINITY_DN91586_c0_g1~~TRINITY_DN91586_c0_g1_i1.p1  ORF type:complete len:507 (-),score=82.67 TRINITY_DN91586_c0_g1_i1:43-1380(-)
MSATLTDALRRGGHRVRPCEHWTVQELLELQRRLFNESEAELLQIYDVAKDKRQRRFANLSAIEMHWHEVNRAAQDEALMPMRRDGLCHEAVMWWVHHLSTKVQKRLRFEGLSVPSLPSKHHVSTTSGGSSAKQLVLKEYKLQVSCQQCHTGKIADPDEQNAGLSPPLPVDAAHPGRERVRSCDFQNKPPCGPCEGLGGRRWGDGPEEMTPMTCEVVSGPEVPPLTNGSYPALAIGRLTGDTRWPLSGKYDGHGHYQNISGSLYLGWKDDLMRMRYDFPGLGSQISIQSLEQASRQDVGATVFLSPRDCSCDASIAGNMHIQAFEASDPLDPLKLPADEGGAAYLGRVRVSLDGDSSLSKRTAIADHYLKWAFHFLVDADRSSATFGLPLRLYASWGVRQVFEGWQVKDPTEVSPHVWDMPQNCTIKSHACSVFQKAASVKEWLV